jgi:hypothetical protein
MKLRDVLPRETELTLRMALFLHGLNAGLDSTGIHRLIRTRIRRVRLAVQHAPVRTVHRFIRGRTGARAG